MTILTIKTLYISICLTGLSNLVAEGVEKQGAQGAQDGSEKKTTEIIVNGGFEQGQTGWRLSQQKEAKAELSLEPIGDQTGSKAARIRIEKQGKGQHLQFGCVFQNDRLEKDKPYVFKFRARSDESTSLQVNLMNRDSPWDNLGLSQNVQLDKQWRDYQFAFRARGSQQAIGKVNFFLGQSQGTIWLDDVVIKPYLPERVKPDGPTLQTAQWQARFFANGALGHLLDKATGQILIEPGVAPEAYTLEVYQAGKKRILSSRQAISISSETFDQGRGLRFIAKHPGLSVALTYQVDAQTGLLECRGAVKNSSEVAITAFTFPIITAPDQLGKQSSDDVILYPSFDGMVIEDPRKVFREQTAELSKTYPGSLSCQVMAYYDRMAGLYIATHDAEGFPKKFSILPGFQTRFEVTHLAPELTGNDLIPAYPTFLGSFTGEEQRGGTTWHDAAELYRKWSEKQDWARLKVKTRKDTPAWLKQGKLVTFFDSRKLTPSGDQSKLTEFLSAYQERYGISLLPNNRGYERYGVWTGQEYRPVWPDEKTFRGSAQAIKALDGQGMLMLSGYRWTLRKTTPEGELYDSQSLFDREVAKWSVHGRDGKPLIHTSSKANDWRGQRWARFCRATDYAKRMIVDFSSYGVKNGYNVIHFDQETSGGYADSVCWSKEHGHPPGHGRWIHQAMADLYQQISDAGRTVDADFALSMEEPNELYLPWLNLCTERSFGITSEWPVAAPGTRPVPLFMYLYHENLIGWVAFYPWQSSGHSRYAVAKGFTIGQMPGLVPPQGLAGMHSTDRERFDTLMKRCIIGYQTFAHDYLVWGRMLKPLDLSTPTRHLSGKGEKKDVMGFSVPAVSHEVWKLDDGRVAVVLVNPEPEAHEIAIDLSLLTNGRNDVSIHEFSTTGGQRTRDQVKFQLTVPALDMMLIEIR